MSDNMIPQGNYTAVATKTTGEDGELLARWGYAGQNKTRQVLVYFRITEGAWEGTTLPWFGFFSQAAGKRTMEALRYIGFEGDDLMSLETQPYDQIVQIVVEHNEYDGKTHPRVAWVNRVGAGAIKLNNPMSQDDLRKFSAQMRQRWGGVPEAPSERATKTNGAHTTTAPPPDHDEPPPIQEDDIPF